MTLPNYRNYWKQAGYAEEMAAIEAAIGAGDRDRVDQLMTDQWIDDCTISGSAQSVRDQLDGWMTPRCAAHRGHVVDHRRPGSGYS